MNTFVLIFFGLAAFLVQYLLTFWQMRKFTRQYQAFRKEGRVAIGKYDGILRSGVIVLFLIDAEGIVKAGTYVEGVTVFAGYKKIDPAFLGRHVASFTTADCKAVHYSKSLTGAVLNAGSNYTILTSGGVLPERQSPFARLWGKLSVSLAKKNN